jgi:hypothetical protein
VRIDQPHPSGAEPEEIDDEREGLAEGAIDIGRAVERLGDVLEDAQVSRVGATRALIS